MTDYKVRQVGESADCNRLITAETESEAAMSYFLHLRATEEALGQRACTAVWLVVRGGVWACEETDEGLTTHRVSF